MALIGTSGIRRSFDVANRMQDVINLGLGEPDFPTPLHIREAAKAAIDAGFNRYTQNAGYLDVREALAEKLLRDQELSYNPETEVMITVGAISGLSLSLLALVSPGDEVIIPDPAFVAFEPCTITAGGTAVPVRLREAHGFRMQASDVEAAVTPRTRVLIVNTPQNPTGAVLSRTDLEALADVARRHNLAVISDEVYEKLVYDGERHTSIASLPGMRERTIVVSSFSKSFCVCGWRIGYAAATHELMEQLLKLQQFHAVHAPSPAQRAVLAALKGPQQWLTDMVEEYGRRRDYMGDALNSLPGMTCTKTGGAFYFFVNIQKLGRSSEEVAAAILQESRVCTIPGSALGRSGEGYLRISYTAPIPVLAEAVERMRPVLKRLSDTVEAGAC